jgi:hypothetical protein
MKCNSILILIVLWTLWSSRPGFSQQSEDPAPQILRLLSIPSYELRSKAITSLVKAYRTHPNPDVIVAVNNLLKQSFAPGFSRNSRIAIANLVGSLGDHSSIPLLLSHFTDLNPDTYPPPLKENIFEERYPYAHGLVYFGHSGAFALLDELRKPHSYLFTMVSRRILMQLGDPHVLLDYYETIQDDQTDDIITEEVYLLVNSMGCDRYMNQKIASQKDPQKKLRLIYLLSKLDAMKPHILNME